MGAFLAGVILFGFAMALVAIGYFACHCRRPQRSDVKYWSDAYYEEEKKRTDLRSRLVESQARVHDLEAAISASREKLAEAMPQEVTYAVSN